MFSGAMAVAQVDTSGEGSDDEAQDDAAEQLEDEAEDGEEGMFTTIPGTFTRNCGYMCIIYP